MAQEPVLPPAALLLSYLCSMATGAAEEFKARADEEEDNLDEKEGRPPQELRRKVCSRRCQRRVAGRLGLLGRLVAQGRILITEAEAEVQVEAKADSD